MSLLITDITEVNIHENHKDYEQIKESVEELRGKINDFNFLSLELDTLHDISTQLISKIEDTNKSLIKQIDHLISIQRDMDYTL